MIDIETIQERLSALQGYVDKLRPMQTLTPEEMRDEERYLARQAENLARQHYNE